MISITIKQQSVVDAFNRFPDLFKRNVNLELKKALTQVQKKARREHRFVTRSGNLERSVTVDVLGNEIGGTVYLEKGIAKYGPYIHEGFKSWIADKFLYEAFNKQIKNIIKAISRGIGMALIEAGLK